MLRAAGQHLCILACSGCAATGASLCCCREALIRELRDSIYGLVDAFKQDYGEQAQRYTQRMAALQQAPAEPGTPSQDWPGWWLCHSVMGGTLPPCSRCWPSLGHPLESGRVGCALLLQRGHLALRALKAIAVLAFLHVCRGPTSGPAVVLCHAVKGQPAPAQQHVQMSNPCPGTHPDSF